jgi:hypothetical protein
MRAAAWLVPDSRTFCDARFSCRELKRFVGIALASMINAEGSGATTVRVCGYGRRIEIMCGAVKDWLERVEVKTLFIEPGSPWENGYVRTFSI